MKALVLENKNGMSAVLMDDGSIGSVRGEFTPGRTVELREVSQSQKKGERVRFRVGHIAAARAVAAAAAAAVVVVSGVGTLYCETAYACSYVSLDVNPSIEFALNRQDRVLEVKPMNEDAAVIVDKLLDSDVKGDTLSAAIAKTKSAVRDLNNDDYSASGTYLVDISSDSVSRAEKLSREVEESFSLDEGDDSTLVLVSSSVEDRYAAQGLGISTGRYAAMRQAKESAEDQNADITDDDVKDFKTKAVKDLVDASEGVSVKAESTRDQTGAAASVDADAGEIKPEVVTTPVPEPAPQPEPETAQVETPPAAQPEQPKQAAAPRKKKKKKTEAADTEAAATVSATESGKSEDNAAEDGATSASTADEAVQSSTQVEGEDTGWAAEEQAQPAATDDSSQVATDSSDQAAADSSSQAGTAASSETDAGAASTNETSNASSGSGSATEVLQASEGATEDTASTGATDGGGG